jgi:transcriptional regulator with XRE-family HTH domain
MKPDGASEHLKILSAARGYKSRNSTGGKITMLFAARLRELRTQDRLSFYDLAQLTGLQPAYLSQIERGEEIPSYSTLETLAEGLDVPLYQLFYDQHPPETPWLTPRPTLEELFNAAPEPRRRAGFLSTLPALFKKSEKSGT